MAQNLTTRWSLLTGNKMELVCVCWSLARLHDCQTSMMPDLFDLANCGNWLIPRLPGLDGLISFKLQRKNLTVWCLQWKNLVVFLCCGVILLTMVWIHLSYYKNRSLAVKPYSQKYYADLVHKPTISNAFVTSFWHCWHVLNLPLLCCFLRTFSQIHFVLFI